MLSTANDVRSQTTSNANYAAIEAVARDIGAIR